MPRYDPVEGLEALTRRIRQEEDGRQLRRQLAKDMRASLKPAVRQAKSGIMGMSSAGGSHSPRLRAGIAKKIRAEAKLGGRWTGARVKAKKTPNLRGFAQAPRRTQRASGWRHPVFGDRDEWVTQRGKIDWFDDSMKDHTREYRDAVLQAMEDMARRIADR